MAFSINYEEKDVFGNCWCWYAMVDYLERNNLPLPVEDDFGGSFPYTVTKDALRNWQAVMLKRTTVVQRLLWRFLAYVYPPRFYTRRKLLELLAL